MRPNVSTTYAVLATCLLTALCCVVPVSTGRAQDAASATEGMPHCEKPAWLKKLLGKHNLTLQWISRDAPGTAVVRKKDGQVVISGRQAINGDYVTINGRITDIDARSFTLEGTVVTRVSHINGGQECTRSGSLTFTATGNRKYWRMRAMDNPCDPVTDYVDVYF